MSTSRDDCSATGKVAWEFSVGAKNCPARLGRDRYVPKTAVTSGSSSVRSGVLGAWHSHSYSSFKPQNIAHVPYPTYENPKCGVMPGLAHSFKIVLRAGPNVLRHGGHLAATCCRLLPKSRFFVLPHPFFYLHHELATPTASLSNLPLRPACI